MSPNAYILRRKLATLTFIAVSIASFATLGEGKVKKTTIKNRPLLAYRSSYDYKNFSLRTGFNYRGMNVISTNKAEGKYLQLNNLVTYQKGNTTYILPLKKKFLSDKVTFAPSAKR